MGFNGRNLTARKVFLELILLQFQSELNVFVCLLWIDNVQLSLVKWFYDLPLVCFSYRREESDIPLVVIGCVQEIEKRGG